MSAEWLHERVAEALQEAMDDKEWQGDRSPSAPCAWWVKQRWLDTEMSDSGVRYRLSPYSLRALRFVGRSPRGKARSREPGWAASRTRYGAWLT